MLWGTSKLVVLTKLPQGRISSLRLANQSLKNCVLIVIEIRQVFCNCNASAFLCFFSYLRIGLDRFMLTGRFIFPSDSLKSSSGDFAVDDEDVAGVGSKSFKSINSESAFLEVFMTEDSDCSCFCSCSASGISRICSPDGSFGSSEALP